MERRSQQRVGGAIPPDAIADAAHGAVSDAPSLRAYLGVGAFLLGFCVVLAMLCRTRSAAVHRDVLLAPMGALFALTAVVWLLMVVVRNLAVMRGRVSSRQYIDYPADGRNERIERPARTFHNLLQVPTLFYVVCLLMMTTGRVDEAQLRLAWLFVAMRAVHAVVYIGWNHLPSRFGVWVAGCIALGVLWVRLLAA